MADETQPIPTPTEPAITPPQVESPPPMTINPFAPMADSHPDPVVEPASDPVDPNTATAKLKAFEDTHLGEDIPRINGEIELGVGSRFANLKPHQKAHHAALEQMIKAEAAVADASAALAVAQARHDAAVKASEAAEEAAAAAEAAETSEQAA